MTRRKNKIQDNIKIKNRLCLPHNLGSLAEFSVDASAGNYPGSHSYRRLPAACVPWAWVNNVVCQVTTLKKPSGQSHPSIRSRLSSRSHPSIRSRLSSRSHPSICSRLFSRSHPSIRFHLTSRSHKSIRPHPSPVVPIRPTVDDNPTCFFSSS